MRTLYYIIYKQKLAPPYLHTSDVSMVGEVINSATNG